ncbi:MAG TPA: hypothetical protein VNI83_04750 [Vicinamibacterales bacterium]|nr:hypothetical protein [Vicinamibacterales bacterium]
MAAIALLLGAALVVAAAIDAREAPVAFLLAAGTAAAAYLAALVRLPRTRWSRRGLILALLAAAIWRLPFLAREPTLSTDLYRYIWDGRVQRAGLNPYAVTPSDPAIAHLHTPVTRRAEHVTLRAVYPPGAQLFFRAVTAVHESPLAVKLALVGCEALTVGLLLAWPGDRARAAASAVAVAWSPLSAIEVAGSGHVDALGVAALAGAFVALARGRRALAVAAFAAAVSVKPLPLVLAPLFWRRIRVRDAVLGAIVLVLPALPFLGPGAPLPMASLDVYLEKYRFNGPLFRLLEPLAGAAGAAGLAIAAGIAVAASFRRRRAIADPAAWAWPQAVVLLLAPVVYPWYLLWLVPFVFSRATLPLGVWTASVILTNAVWISVRDGAGWTLPAWVLPAEYGAVAVALLVWRVAERRWNGRQAGS